MTVPFLAVGNAELVGLPRAVAGDRVNCPKHKRGHELKGSKRVLPDGSREPSDTLLFFTCRRKTYLAAIDGALLFGHTVKAHPH